MAAFLQLGEQIQLPSARIMELLKLGKASRVFLNPTELPGNHLPFPRDGSSSLPCSQQLSLDHPGIIVHWPGSGPQGCSNSHFSTVFLFPLWAQLCFHSLGIPLDEGLSQFSLQVSQRKGTAENSFSSWIFSQLCFSLKTPLQTLQRFLPC